MGIIVREKEIMESLQREIVIPDIVQTKADRIFQKIRKENGKVTVKRERKWKTVWVAVAAAVLAIGTTVCAAVYRYYSRGLEAEFQMTEEFRQLLEEKEYMAPIVGKDGTHEGVTCGGVTVTPLQMIVDERFAWLSFQVEGYVPEEGKEPCFEQFDVTIDHDPEACISAYASFYDGCTYTAEKGFVWEDGTPAYDADGNLLQKYVDEEGRMEYIVEIVGTNYEKGMIGASVHVAFDGLGTTEKAVCEREVDGVWEFDMTLKGSDEVRKFTLSQSLGDSGATVTYAEVSPISVYAVLDFPLQKEEIEAENENGEKISTSTFVHAPQFVGLRLKDGTFLTGIINGGTEGYRDSEETYVMAYSITPVVDVEEIDALLFWKSEPALNGRGVYDWKEENLYIVPVE